MANFLYKSDFKYKVNPDYAVLTSKFENGYEQRRLKHSLKLRVYDLVFSSRTKTEFDDVNIFFDNKKGSLTAFTISIDNEDILGVFIEGTFQYSLIAYQVYDYGFRFREVAA